MSKTGCAISWVFAGATWVANAHTALAIIATALAAAASIGTLLAAREARREKHLQAQKVQMQICDLCLRGTPADPCPLGRDRNLCVLRLTQKPQTTQP